MEPNSLLVMSESKLAACLDRAGKSLRANQELVLDFSAVVRVDSPGLSALQDFALRAEEKHVKAFFRGVNVNVYKALKLARLTREFSFVN
jgi:anti-anti-sigma regulatory factor